MTTANAQTLALARRQPRPATLDAWALAARGRRIAALLIDRPNGYAVSELMALDAGATVRELADRLTGVLGVIESLETVKGIEALDAEIAAEQASDRELRR